MKVEWIAKRSEDADNTVGTYLLHIMSETEGPLLVTMISEIMFLIHIQVHKLQFKSHRGHFELALSVEAHNMHRLLWYALSKGMTIVLRKLASRYVDWDFPNGKSHALRAPRTPAIRILLENSGDHRYDHVFMEFTVICLERPESLIDVACSLLDSKVHTSAIIEKFEVPSFGGIKVPRSFMVIPHLELNV